MTRYVAIAIALLAVRAENTVAQWMPRVELTQESNLDWKFAESRSEAWHSPKHMRNDTLVGAPYCEIEVPTKYDAKTPTPVLLYLSPGPQPQAFRRWKRTLQRKRFIFVAPHHVGNNVAVETRIERAILALDYVRTNYNVDPDRTYIVGFSGGARVAKHLAYSYPEYFGGLIQTGSGGRLPSDEWLINRIEERLRVALIVGKRDGFQPEVEYSTHVTLRETGVETRLWLPATGHTLPASRVISEAIQWLDEGLEDRRALAAEFPTTRLIDHLAPEEHAQRFFDEASQRIAKPKHLLHGVLLLDGIAKRWPETEAGKQAKVKFGEYEQGNDRTWKDERAKVRLRRLVADARGTEAMGTAKTLHLMEAQRPIMLQTAIGAWKGVLVFSADSDLRAEAEESVKRLEALLK